MAENTKKLLIVAAVLILAGGILFGGAIDMLKWDFGKLSTDKYQTTEYTPGGSYKDIVIATETAQIQFLPSGDAGTKVVCYEEKTAKHIVSVENGVLTVRVQNNKKWYDYIGVFFDTPKITIYMPAGEYGDLGIDSDTGAVQIPAEFKFASMDIRESNGKVTNCASVTGTMQIKTSTGDITVEKVSAGAMELAVSTGRIIVRDVSCQGDVTVNVSTGKAGLTNVECRNLKSDGATGDLSLDNVIAAEAFRIERSTGDVDFEGCDAAEITVTTDTGHIRGSLLSDKVFIAETDTGRVDVPHTTTGGKCELTTDTGNIKISIR